jgi:hypothetical protein
MISSISVAKKWQKTACKIFGKKGRYLLETWEQAGGNPFSLIDKYNVAYNFLLYTATCFLHLVCLKSWDGPQNQ